MLQSANHRLLLQPQEPAQLVPFGSFSLSPLPFLPLFLLTRGHQGELEGFLLFFFCLFFPLCKQFRDPKGEKSRRTPGSWGYPFAESRRQLPLAVPVELGSADPGAAGQGLSRMPLRRAAPTSRGSRRGGVWAGRAACPLRSPQRESMIPPSPPRCRSPSGGERGQRGHLVLWDR